MDFSYDRDRVVSALARFGIRVTGLTVDDAHCVLRAARQYPRFNNGELNSARYVVRKLLEVGDGPAGELAASGEWPTTIDAALVTRIQLDQALRTRAAGLDDESVIHAEAANRIISTELAHGLLPVARLAVLRVGEVTMCEIQQTALEEDEWLAGARRKAAASRGAVEGDVAIVVRAEVFGGMRYDGMQLDD